MKGRLSIIIWNTIRYSTGSGAAVRSLRWRRIPSGRSMASSTSAVWPGSMTYRKSIRPTCAGISSGLSRYGKNSRGGRMCLLTISASMSFPTGWVTRPCQSGGRHIMLGTTVSWTACGTAPDRGRRILVRRHAAFRTRL